jgi:hypothetical protein
MIQLPAVARLAGVMLVVLLLAALVHAVVGR